MQALTISTLIALLCFATTAEAQNIDTRQMRAPWASRGDMRFEEAPWRAEGTDPLRDACLRGNADSCLTIDLGQCRSEDPRIAIPACSRRLRQDYSQRQEVRGRTLRAAVYAFRGAAHFKQGDVEQAIDDYNQSILAHDGYYWVYTNLATAQFDSGDYAASLHSIDEAIRLVPDSPLLLSGRARLLVTAPDEEMRDPQMALNDVTKAISLSGDNVPLHFYDTLAAVHAANGDFNQAVEIQQRVVGQVPPENESDAAEYQNRLDDYLLQQYLRTPPIE